MAPEEADLVEQGEELEGSGFDGGTMAEVCADSDDQVVLVVDDALKEIVQGFEALFEWERSASVECAFLTIENHAQRIEYRF
jgi:hypothetical protein